MPNGAETANHFQPILNPADVQSANATSVGSRPLTLIGLGQKNWCRLLVLASTTEILHSIFLEFGLYLVQKTTQMNIP